MSITLRFGFEVDSVLTDVTSAVLSDPTGTYGVKRDDNDAVVVADGTAMSKVATGTYEYSFTEPVDGLEYTYYVEYVYEGQTYWDENSYADSTKVVTLAEVKKNSRITHTEEDTFINDLIDAATDWAEKYTRRKFLSQTCIDYFDRFPTVIRPRWSPLASVSSIQYVDTNGNTQTWAAANYDIDTDSERARIQRAYNQSYPSTRNQMNAVTITYVAGYGTSADDVPATIRHALLLIVGHWYENREATTALKLEQVPLAARTLLDMERLIEP